MHFVKRKEIILSNDVINIEELFWRNNVFLYPSPLFVCLFVLDFFKYIPFRSWFNKAVWNISIISTGRGNIKVLMTNYYRCSGTEKLMVSIAQVWKAVHCHSYNYTVAYGSFYSLGVKCWNYSRLAISLETSKCPCCSWWEVPIPDSKGVIQSPFESLQSLLLGIRVLTR